MWCRLTGVCLTLLLLSGGTALAAGPFSDVPPDSWAYKAVAQLARDGMVDGYPDGTFAGNRPITRYEMAQIISRALTRLDEANARQQATLSRLSEEFNQELANLGAKVNRLSDEVDRRVYMTGEAVLSYDDYSNSYHYTAGGVKITSSDLPYNNGDKKFATDLYVHGKINDNWTYYANLHNNKYFGSGTGTPASYNTTEFNQAYVQGDLAGLTVAVGQLGNTPAYGLVDSEDLYGLQVGGGGDVLTWQVAWGNTTKLQTLTQQQLENPPAILDPTTGSWNKIDVSWVDLSLNVALADNWNVKAAYMKAFPESGSSDPDFYIGKGTTVNSMYFYEFGTDWRWAPDWLLTAVYGQSSALGQNRAYRAQIDYGQNDVNLPGSWHMWLAYTRAEALSTWDSTYGDMPGQNTNIGDIVPFPNIFGSQGWEIGFDYVFAKNIYLHGKYNDYGPTVTSVNDSMYNVSGIGGSLKHFAIELHFLF
ncbi:MAG: S-layer homology domain-containing protein [Negativicutes bacterium]|nr:S-layer homology domain-containing protein [Negativicutes bacterium]